MKASIDIGSNTVLLLVGEVQNGNVIVHHEAQRIPRLAKGVDEKKNLDPESIQRATRALKEYKKVLSQLFEEVKEVAVLATSAVRDANNRLHFIDQVRRETGWTIQVLTGEEEAELMYQGAVSVLTSLPSSSAVIDIGGGSTEVAVGKEGELHDIYSFNIGSVRFTERFLKSDAPTDNEIDSCRSTIKQIMQNRAFELDKSTKLIGIAGTVTSLAAMVNGIQVYEPDRINNLEITRTQLLEIIRQFSAHSSSKMLNRFPDILEGRADVILAGLLILDEFMKLYDQTHVIVSTGGIRHGAILNK